ncbi:hypothetical protein FHG87_023382 [Trinorchestia longiramus]|nr:hypothetical protein FHG87_023382 [Trinorchestia longiramus]
MGVVHRQVATLPEGSWELTAMHHQDFVRASLKETLRCSRGTLRSPSSCSVDEECNMTVVDAKKDFLVHAWNKRQGC